MFSLENRCFQCHQPTFTPSLASYSLKNKDLECRKRDGEVNAAFEWISTTVKKTLTKDFTSQEADIEKLQKLMEEGKIQVNQRTSWENIGLAFGTILENEMEGMMWVSVIEGSREYAALQFGDLLVNPAHHIWSRAKVGEPIDLKVEFARIKEEVEKRL